MPGLQGTNIQNDIRTSPCKNPKNFASMGKTSKQMVFIVLYSFTPETDKTSVGRKYKISIRVSLMSLIIIEMKYIALFTF